MRADLINGLLLATALVLAMLGALRQESEAVVSPTNIIAAGPPDAEDATEIEDARGRAVPVADYKRIASLNTVGDHLLLHLVEPERIVSVTGHTLQSHPEGWRFGDRPGIARSDQLEQLFAVRPDLVLASKFADEALLERVRERGIVVFDLGEMRGVATTLANIGALGALLGQRERAKTLERAFLRDLAALDAAVPDAEMPPGIYLSVYGDAFFGGTDGSSYADMLHYGGVRDLAPEHGFREWPRYSPEQLLTIAPPLIVTQEGMGTLICGHSLLSDLPACGPEGQILEVPGEYHSDPGLGLVEGAAGILTLLHPDAAPRTAPRTVPGGSAPP